MLKKQTLHFLPAIALGIIVFAVLLTNISCHPQKTQRPIVERQELVITYDEHLQTADIEQGMNLTVKLEMQPGTTYHWKLWRIDPEKLKPLAKPTFEPIPYEPAIPRVGEYQVFRFRAYRPGTVMLELHYLCPWKKENPLFKVYQVMVNIKPFARYQH